MIASSCLKKPVYVHLHVLANIVGRASPDGSGISRVQVACYSLCCRVSSPARSSSSKFEFEDVRAHHPVWAKRTIVIVNTNEAFAGSLLFSNRVGRLITVQVSPWLYRLSAIRPSSQFILCHPSSSSDLSAGRQSQSNRSMARMVGRTTVKPAMVASVAQQRRKRFIACEAQHRSIRSHPTDLSLGCCIGTEKPIARVLCIFCQGTRRKLNVD